MRYRLDKAYEYAVAHPDALVITTGGQGRDEWVPEGQAMRNYLIEKGLDSHRVLAECKSTSTEENFLFAKEILVQQGISAQEPVVYVTNAFHCYRGGVYAAMAGFTTAHALPAGIPLRSVLTCYLREAAAVIYYWLFKSSRTGFMQPLVGLLSLNKSSFTNDVKQFAAIPALPKNTMCGFAVQDGRVSCRSVITKNTAAT